MEPGERAEPIISMLVVDRRLCQEEDEIIHAPPPVDALELPYVLITQVLAWIASEGGCRSVGRVRLSQSQCCVGQFFKEQKERVQCLGWCGYGRVLDVWCSRLWRLSRVWWIVHFILVGLCRHCPENFYLTLF